MALLAKLRRTERQPPASANRERDRASSAEASGDREPAHPAERVHELTSKGRFGDALALVDELLAASQDDAALALARASTLFEWARYHEALPWFRRAEVLGSDDFNLYLRGGWASLWAVNGASAEPWMRKAAERDDGEWTAHFGLATSLRAQGGLDEAIAAFERAVEVAPGNLFCLAQLADCMLVQKKATAAERYARRAIAANDKDPVAWTNLGVALVAQDRFEEAIAAFEHADRLAQSSGSGSDQHLNLGICLRDTGRLDSALALYERRLPMLPGIGVNTHYAHALLTAGRFAEGWRQYEFRWMQPPLLALRAPFRKPIWTGQDLRGKTILLRAEQGIGDVVQFIRYAPHVKALGARVLLQLRDGLGQLPKAFPGIDEVLDGNRPFPAFDYYIHLMSLPSVFGTELACVPAAVPYLEVEPARRARWAARLGAGTALKVGLVWAGDANHLRDRYRSIALAALGPLADVAGVRFYSLQKGAAASQMSAPPAGMPIDDLGAELEDFADTAAVLDQLDLVISVDTSVAHLAGALGKRVWMLIPTPADWRWLTDRDDTPWYPTMRLFRQRRQGDWQDVVQRVSKALRELLATDRLAVRESSASDSSQGQCLRPVDSIAPPLPGMTAVTETAMGIVQYFPDQPYVGESIREYGEYLRAQTYLLLRLVTPGAFVMEVGSGIGAHVLALAPAVGAAGHFFLYEPRPVPQQVLRQNLAVNGVGNVTIMKRTLGGVRQGDVGEGISAAPLPEDASELAQETIDDLRLDRLDWLKIAEGDAIGVLAGASATIWRLRPKVFVAVADEGGLRPVTSRLQDFGYQCWKTTTPYFNPENFNRRDADIFRGGVAHAVLAIPEEVEAPTGLDGCERL
jgi:tetratricopeptide (TPR) repeat protein